MNSFLFYPWFFSKIFLPKISLSLSLYIFVIFLRCQHSILATLNINFFFVTKFEVKLYLLRFNKYVLLGCGGRNAKRKLVLCRFCKKKKKKKVGRDSYKSTQLCQMNESTYSEMNPTAYKPFTIALLSHFTNYTIIPLTASSTLQQCFLFSLKF